MTTGKRAGLKQLDQKENKKNGHRKKKVVSDVLKDALYTFYNTWPPHLVALLCNGVVKMRLPCTLIVCQDTRDGQSIKNNTENKEM